MRTGITMGDPSGIGPEIILKALAKRKTLKNLQIYASKGILYRTAQDLKIVSAYHRIEDRIVDCVRAIKFSYGKPTMETARSAITAIDFARQQGLDVLITAPIVKDAVRLFDPAFTGHTEYLAEYFGVKRYAMMGLFRDKRIMLLTSHLPLRKAIKCAKSNAVNEKIQFLHWGLRKYFRIARPRIGVAAMNPHAFEFSSGEDEEILKGVLKARAQGIRAQGPFAADSLFDRDFDGFLAMFHDQAFVYLKAKKSGLNFTLGLPLVRMSPLYGAALDIAGRNRADYSGMQAALDTGEKIAGAARKRPGPGSEILKETI